MYNINVFVLYDKYGSDFFLFIHTIYWSYVDNILNIFFLQIVSLELN